MTALELINRVMLLRRQPTISAYQETNPEHVATLNVLNMMKEDLLATRRPEFDLRHDGQLITRASVTSRDLVLEMSATEGEEFGLVAFNPATDFAEEIPDGVVARLIPTDDADYNNTAFRVYGYSVGFLNTVGFTFKMPKDFTSVVSDLIYAEYLLPSTVREVVRASYEQLPLNLTQIDPTIRFDELYPSLTEEQGSPRSFSVGGFDNETYDFADVGTVEPKLRAIIWPVPDDAYVINYSYYYRHPDFTDGDSELIGVPAEFVNDIVLAAYSLMAQAWDGNTDAATIGADAQRSASVKGNLYSGSSARRHRIGSWDNGHSMVGLPEGFPGRILGPSS